jgi:hypothetical protein
VYSLPGTSRGVGIASPGTPSTNGPCVTNGPAQAGDAAKSTDSAPPNTLRPVTLVVFILFLQFHFTPYAVETTETILGIQGKKKNCTTIRTHGIFAAGKKQARIVPKYQALL